MEGGSVAVIDVGSGSVKAGWAGDDCPTAMPAAVAPPNAKPATGARIDCLEQQSSDALGPRLHPVSRGQVRDWEQLERLWRHVLEQEMAVQNTETIAAMVVEAPSVPAQDRAKLAEMLFETLRVTSVCFANSASLSLLASGRVSGLSVETGAGVTHVCPVFQGLVLSHAQSRVEIGGQDISSAVCQTLRQNGVQIEFADARQVKETYSYLKSRFTKREPNVMSFSLPDGSTVELEDSLVAQSAEVLFEAPGLNIAEATLESLALCDSYARNCVAQSVVVSGGTSMLLGFGDRIYDYLHEHGEADACVFPSTQYYESGYTSQRRHAAWIGGSILASLTAFNHLKITRAEWEENAEAVTRAKRF